MTYVGAGSRSNRSSSSARRYLGRIFVRSSSSGKSSSWRNLASRRLEPMSNMPRDCRRDQFVARSTRSRPQRLLPRADVLEQAVHAERDERRSGEAEAEDRRARDRPSRRRGLRSATTRARRRARRDSASATKPEPGRERNREPRVQQVVRVAEAGEVDRERQRRGGRRARQPPSPTRPLSRSSPRYCLMYGRPIGAGGIDGRSRPRRRRG